MRDSTNDLMRKLTRDQAYFVLGKDDKCSARHAPPVFHSRPQTMCGCGACCLSRSIERGLLLLAAEKKPQFVTLKQLKFAPLLVLQELVLEGFKGTLAVVVFSFTLAFPLIRLSSLPLEYLSPLEVDTGFDVTQEFVARTAPHVVVPSPPLQPPSTRFRVFEAQ